MGQKPNFKRKFKIRMDPNDLWIDIDVTSFSGPGSEEYEYYRKIDEAIHTQAGRSFGHVIKRKFRGVDHEVVYTEEGWLLDGEKWFPSLNRVKNHLIDPAGDGSFARQKIRTIEDFFDLPLPKKK